MSAGMSWLIGFGAALPGAGLEEAGFDEATCLPATPRAELPGLTPMGLAPVVPVALGAALTSSCLKPTGFWLAGLVFVA